MDHGSCIPTLQLGLRLGQAKRLHSQGISGELRRIRNDREGGKKSLFLLGRCWFFFFHFHSFFLDVICWTLENRCRDF